MCTILMLAIIQGLYILREDEDEQIETQRKKRLKEEEREQRLREREIARLRRKKEPAFNFCIGLLYIDLCQSDRISGLF